MNRMLLAGVCAVALLATGVTAAKAGDDEDLDLKVKWKGAPEFSNKDGSFKFKIRGRIMGDYDNVDQDTAITGEPDISGTELRRARLGVEGVIMTNFKYKFEVDFAGDEVSTKDAYVAWANWAPVEKSEVRAGNQYVYSSLEQVTSSRFITFNERAAFIDAFFLERQIGVGVLLGDDHWSFQTGYYGAPPDEQGDFSDDTSAFTVRGTVAPINTDTTVLHAGASYRHRDAGTSRDTGTAELFQYRARPDNHLADRFIETPNFASGDDMFVLEGAAVFKSLSVQGEYAQLEADDALAGFNPTYNGYYIDASWFITGEMRNYEADSGEFGRTKVLNPVTDGGWGAWQIAGRYDVLDLSDGSGAIPGCTECGEQKTWLIGLNWLTTDYTALKLQVAQAEIDGGANDGAEITSVGLRAQIDW
ncbi:OprO/OprP family phosphate-selective porin [Methyloligella halotolerans]|nr:porin [Methyloligella halotolerans]